MTLYRSYLSKCSTLIKGNTTNNSLNPVTELFYGTENQATSRFILDVDLSGLNKMSLDGSINLSNVKSHTLKLTNTIAYFPTEIGKPSYDPTTRRTSGFQLDLYTLKETWDQGNGYDFIYGRGYDKYAPSGATNWYNRTTNNKWAVDGSYVSGGTNNNVIATQYFQTGNENIEMNITNFINSKLFVGVTGFTGTTYGLGLKFPNVYENNKTLYREAVAYHTKHTNTAFEPYIETIIDDQILDDRYYFYLDRDNSLYLYCDPTQTITIQSVNIYDHEDNKILTYSGNTITTVSKNIFKITVNISSDTYPDAIIFTDVWNITVNGKSRQVSQDFYLISDTNSYMVNNKINLNNYHLTLLGIKDNEVITNGSNRNIKINVKELYSSKNNLIPLNIEYRVYMTAGTKYQLDIIPFTQVNRVLDSYEFNIDFSWLIHQDYYLEIRQSNGNHSEVKKTLRFTIGNTEII